MRHGYCHNAGGARGSDGFTLVELMMASVAGAIIFAALYGLFTKAVHMRDDATIRVREARMRARALSVLRNDIQNGYISAQSAASATSGSTPATGTTGSTGTAIAQTLTSSASGNSSQFPGYLRFTTTTGRITDPVTGGDVQEVEYYIVNDPNAEQRGSGMLVRSVTRDLLSTVQQDGQEETLLTGVSSMEVEFYDGDTWTDSWNYAPGNPDPLIPQAVRVRIQQAGTNDRRQAAPPPLEVVAFWSAQPMYP